MVGPANLTGKWSSDDKGSYYFRQVGDTLYGYGEQTMGNTAWSNILVGTISGLTIQAKWFDLPKGKTNGYGALYLKIQEDGDAIVAVKKTGDIAANRWTRITSQPPPPHIGLNPPSNLTVQTAPGGNGALLKWHLPADYDGFEAFRAADLGTGSPPPDGSYAKISDIIRADSYHDTALSSPGIYWYRMRTTYGNLRSTQTSPVPFDYDVIITGDKRG